MSTGLERTRLAVMRYAPTGKYSTLTPGERSAYRSASTSLVTPLPRAPNRITLLPPGQPPGSAAAGRTSPVGGESPWKGGGREAARYTVFGSVARPGGGLGAGLAPAPCVVCFLGGGGERLGAGLGAGLGLGRGLGLAAGGLGLGLGMGLGRGRGGGLFLGGGGRGLGLGLGGGRGLGLGDCFGVNAAVDSTSLSPPLAAAAAAMATVFTSGRWLSPAAAPSAGASTGSERVLQREAGADSLSGGKI